MAITVYGYASNPTPDSGTAARAGPGPISVTSPASMLAGDLVFMVGQYRGAVTITISEAGGQSWNTLAPVAATNVTGQVFWCRFNGTWTADPSITNTSGTNALTAVMIVFRPTTGSNLWGVDVAQTEEDFAAPGADPWSVTLTGRSTVNASTVTLALWFAPDDNAWATVSGGSWVDTGLSPRWRNTTGQDQAVAPAYVILTSQGSTGNVNKDQITLGGDAGTSAMVTMYEYAAGAQSQAPRSMHQFRLRRA